MTRGGILVSSGGRRDGALASGAGGCAERPDAATFHLDRVLRIIE
jgi:hypothetical protein